MNLSTVVAPSDLWPWPHLVMSHLISGSLVHNCVGENLNECHLGDPDYDLVCQRTKDKHIVPCLACGMGCQQKPCAQLMGLAMDHHPDSGTTNHTITT